MKMHLLFFRENFNKNALHTYIKVEFDQQYVIFPTPDYSNILYGENSGSGSSLEYPGLDFSCCIFRFCILYKGKPIKGRGRIINVK